MKPRTRLNKFLAKIAGVYDGELNPKTETEYYLDQIAQSGGGGGGDSSIYLVRFSLNPETNRPIPTYPEGTDSLNPIEDAMQRGQVVMCLYSGDVFAGGDEDEFGYLPLTYYYHGSNMIFSGTSLNGLIYTISWEERHGWSASTFTAEQAQGDK